MNFDFINNIAESVGWCAYCAEQNDGKEFVFEFETWTNTAGQNVLVPVVVSSTENKGKLLEQVAHELNECYKAFDPEEAAGLYWQIRDTVRGVPSSLHLLLDDMDEAKGLIERLSYVFAKEWQELPCECCTI